MPDISTPVARPGETLVHLHFIDPDTQDRSTWIGASVARSLRASEGRLVLDVTIDVGADPAVRGYRIGDMVKITGRGELLDGRTGPVAELDGDPEFGIGIKVDGFLDLVWCNSGEIRHLDAAEVAAAEAGAR